jgi:hypothetical protein
MENTPDRTDASRAYEMESAQITPEECEQNAAHSCPQWRPGWNLAAATIRSLQAKLEASNKGGLELMRQRDEAAQRAAAAEEQLAASENVDALLRLVARYELDMLLLREQADDANERAQKAEQELAALQNGSHPLQVQLREADCRAAKAEEELAAMRAETAGLREANPAAVYPDLGTAQGGPWVVQRDTNMRWAEADQPEIVIANFDGKHRELQPGPQGEVNIGGARYTVVEEPPKSCCTYCGKPDHD